MHLKEGGRNFEITILAGRLSLNNRGKNFANLARVKNNVHTKFEPKIYWPQTGQRITCVLRNTKKAIYTRANDDGFMMNLDKESSN